MMDTTYDSRLYELDLSNQVARYMPAEIRTGLEERYYGKINRQALLEWFLQDPAFLEDPATHVALYTDHGVVHVRDVARQILRVIDTVNGVLVPERTAGRLEFMKGYGVM